MTDVVNTADVERSDRRAKLTPDEVLAIRAQREHGASVIDLAEQYEVSVRTIYNVLTRQSWKRLP